MSSENSSYESAPLAPEPEVETPPNAPAPSDEGETMLQEETSNLAPDPDLNASPLPDPNPEPTTANPPEKTEEAIKIPATTTKPVTVAACTATISSTPSDSSPNANSDSQTQCKPRFRHDYYDSATEVVLTIFAEGISKENVSVDFGEQILSVVVDVPGEDPYHYQPHLFGKIVPEKCIFTVLSTKIEIRLCKAEAVTWASLEFSDKKNLPQKVNTPGTVDQLTEESASTSQRSTYPPSKSKVEAQVEKEEKEEKLDGDAALNKFFRDIYQVADEDTRRAMSKSFAESNGTVLSTKWKDVVERLMEYVQEVAVYGSENMNRLELIIARAYLKSFDKFRGFPDAPEFGYGEEFGNDPDKFPGAKKSRTGKGRKKKDEEDENKQQSEATPKKRGRPKKHKQVQANADDANYDLQSGSERDNNSKKAKKVKVSGVEYNLSSESNSKPKKRGRPKKKKQVEISDDEYELLAESDEMPKKRGRPKKKKQAEISDDEYDTLSESDEMPKKRGRPKKKKKQTETSNDEYDPSSESDEMPKKRGRPKKKHDEIFDEEFESVSKSRMRSSKLKTPTKSDTSTPRKRGRPKKSMGLGISDEDFDSPLKTQSTLSKSKTPTKSDTGKNGGKKRGRPRKEVAQGPTVPDLPVEYPPCTDMFTELCLTAQNPQKSSNFTATMQSLFTKYKDSLATDTFKGKDLIEETGSATKSGRRVSIPKHIQDSYWTDVLVDTGSDKDEEPASTSGQKKKRGPYNKKEKNNSKNGEADVSPTEEEILVSTDTVAESSDESGPAGLVLYFNNPDAIPIEKELNEIFGTYGLLREADTEIDKNLNRATVVFKRRSDAEVAFSSAGKYSKFGPALLSYELNYSPGPPKVSSSDRDVVGNVDAFTAGANNMVDNGEASTKGGSGLEICPGEEGKEEPAQVTAEADRPVEPSA